MHYACWNDRTEIIKLLFKYGADFNVVNKSGSKPLMLCNENTRTEMCNYMKELAKYASFLVPELCKHNKVFAKKAAQFIMTLKDLKKTKGPSFNVPRPLILMMLQELALDGSSIGEILATDNVDELITKWKTRDKK